jgi:hypothetical protein
MTPTPDRPPRPRAGSSPRTTSAEPDYGATPLPSALGSSTPTPVPEAAGPRCVRCSATARLTVRLVNRNTSALEEQPVCPACFRHYRRKADREHRARRVRQPDRTYQYALVAVLVLQGVVVCTAVGVWAGWRTGQKAVKEITPKEIKP